jgi:hypothetical protein
MRQRLLVAAMLAVVLVVGLLGGVALADHFTVKHTICVAMSDPNPTKLMRYLPNPADPCPGPSWTKEDWIND